MNNAEYSSLRIAKLLTTRMCHDLAGPLGGISNGVEFLSESLSKDESTQQYLSLLALSSGEGSAKLQMYRQAYGIINQIGDKTDLNILTDIFDNFFQQNKIDISWEAGGVNAIDHRSRQLLVNLVLIASSTLITGGTLSIKCTDGDKLTISLFAQGQQIKRDPDLLKVFSRDMPLEQLTPQTAQAFFTVSLADELGTNLEHNYTETSFSISANNLP